MLRGARGLVIYGAGLLFLLELMLWGAIFWWPALHENMGAVINMTKLLPVLGNQVQAIETGGVVAYVTGQHFFKGCSALGVAACVLLAAPSIAGEAQRGTLEIMLARPVSRLRLYSERWLGGFAAWAVPIAASSLTIPYLMTSMELEQSMEYLDVLRCTIYMIGFLAPIYAFTMAWSAVDSDPILISYATLFTSILAFALYFVEVATDFTPFRLVDMRVFMDIVKDDRLEWRYFGPMVASTVILYFVGLRWFLRRTP